MTTDTLPEEAPGLPLVITGTFWFCLTLSVAGNVAATWGHPQDAIIGGLFPVLLVLAERVLHAAGRAPWWVRVLIGAVAAACMVWSANHLATLASGWMRWLIPVAVDALLLLSGLLIVLHSSRETTLPQETREAPALLVAQEAPLLYTVPEPPLSQEIREEIERGRAKYREAREAPRETTIEETVTETKTTTRRVSSSGDLSELASRLRAGVEAGETKPTISAAKTYLGVGHAKAKGVVALLQEA